MDEVAIDDGAPDETPIDDLTVDAVDDIAIEESATGADELAGILLDDLLARPPSPPQATRPMMQVLSRLVFKFKNGILMFRLVIAASLLLC